MGDVVRPDFGSVGPRRIETDHVGDAPTCLHEYVAIQRNARRVVCRSKNCGRVLDPFDVLLSLARDWDNATHARAEWDRLQKEIDALKREKRNLKAQVRRATMKVEKA